jgi:hypothetical protein
LPDIVDGRSLAVNELPILLPQGLNFDLVVRTDLLQSDNLHPLLEFALLRRFTFMLLLILLLLLGRAVRRHRPLIRCCDSIAFVVRIGALRGSWLAEQFECVGVGLQASHLHEEVLESTVLLHCHFGTPAPLALD